MAPKKAQKQKMSLNDFLGDNTLGSWADEMDSLPSAPAVRTDEDRSRRGERGDFGNRFDDYPSRERESRYPPREELPLPTSPPYTAFVGNLSFDLAEADIEEFFGTQLKSVKIIRDRDDKPKGFGYVEFNDLQGLKDGLAKSGGQLNSRTVRVSVAEPPKERGGFDDDKFGGNWRRDGPLPANDRGFDRGPRGSGPPPSRYEDSGADRGERMGMGSKFVPSGPSDRPARGMGGPSRFSDAPPSEAETTSDWRGSRPMRAPAPPSNMDRPGPPAPRRGSGFSTPEGPPHASEMEDTWSKGSKFTPSDAPKERGTFARREPGLKADEDTGDWRSAPRKSPVPPGRNDRSPTGSVPSTPNLSRKKLDLLPRSAAQSNAPSPISSPKSPSAGGEWRSTNGAQTPTLTATSARSNPFGSAKPVDVVAREKEIEQKLEERSSKVADTAGDASLRSPSGGPPKAQERGWGGSGGGGSGGGGGGGWRDRKAPTSSSKPTSATHSRNPSHEGGKPAAGGSSASTSAEAKKLRSGFSFAAAASGLDVAEGEEDDEEGKDDGDVDEVEKKVAEITV